MGVMGDPHERNPPGAPRTRAVPALLIRGHEVPLGLGDTMIGRGGDADISILGALVSRHHARIVNTGKSVTIEDAGSRNGVFVNGVRVDKPTPLLDGDTVLIGTTEIAFFFGAPDIPVIGGQVAFDEQGNFLPEGEPTGARQVSTLVKVDTESASNVDLDREDITVQGSRPPPPKFSSQVVARDPSEKLARREAQANPPSSNVLPRLQPRASSSRPPDDNVLSSRPTSGVAEPLSTVLGVVARMLSRGDSDAAARTLAPQLAKRIQTSRSGQPIAPDVLENTGLICLELFSKSGDPPWFDAMVDLYTVAKRPMTTTLLDRLDNAVSSMPADSRERFEGYKKMIRNMLGTVSLEELECCERILSLKI